MSTISLIKTWYSGNNSITLIIPKQIAKKYGLQKPTTLILVENHNGILLKKLEIKS